MSNPDGLTASGFFLFKIFKTLQLKSMFSLKTKD